MNTSSRSCRWDADDTTGAEVGDEDRTMINERDTECSEHSSRGRFCTANGDHRGPHVAGTGSQVTALWPATSSGEQP